jgi:hypothetical protein
MPVSDLVCTACEVTPTRFVDRTESSAMPTPTHVSQPAIATAISNSTPTPQATGSGADGMTDAQSDGLVAGLICIPVVFAAFMSLLLWRRLHRSKDVTASVESVLPTKHVDNPSGSDLEVKGPPVLVVHST